MTTIKNEVERLTALPQQGWFTLLHHKGPVIEESQNLMERVNYILQNKPESERLTRLRNIYYVRPEQVAEYKRIEQSAWAEYKRIRQSAWAEYKRIRQSALAEFERIEQSALAEYERIRRSAWAEFERIEQSALAEYELALHTWLLSWVPWSSWNGKSIL